MKLGWVAGVLLATAVLAGGQASGPDGVWVGTAGAGARAVPFRLEVRGSGDAVRGAWVNGSERAESTAGSFQNGVLTLRFDYFANTLTATVHDGQLTGSYGGHLHPVALEGRLETGAPDISGDWIVQVASSKHENAWRLHVSQRGDEVTAAILRIDGDTGSLYGSYQDGEFALSRFSASGPSRMRLEPQSDGTLLVNGHPARRPSAAEAAGWDPDNPERHTTWNDPDAPLTFRYPDLQGKIVVNTDARFRGKVVIVAIGGSWCPNCHDEAPFLESLYRRYRARGLEVVDLSFEEQEQLANPTRLRAFVAQYGITYPVLLAGQPDQLAAALPQARHLDCWPTMFFIGRDGRVKSIRAGYAGKASGAAHTEELRETRQLLDRLLAP